MRHTNRQRRTRRSLWSAALLLSLAGLAGGCDQDGDARKALDAASVELGKIDTGLGASASAATRDKVYTSVISTLGPASSSDRSAYASSANILLAKAHAGLAETPAELTTSLEAESMNRSRVLRADLAQWLEMSAIAASAERYDPAPEIAALESQITQINDAIVGLTKARARIADRHAALTAEASGLEAKAEAIRAVIGEHRLRATTVSATEGAAIAEQVRIQSREADALERKASEIMAEASPLVPQIEEIDLNMAGLSNQTASLRAAQEAAAQRGRDARAEADEARALASTASARLDIAANELISLREGEMAKSYEQALRSLSTAAAAARKAATDSRSSSKLAEGAALQQTGDLWWQRAHGLGEHHALMFALANAKPLLPKSGVYEATAVASDAERGEALSKAAEAFEQAKSALTSSGARGETSDRLERVGRMLDLIIQATRGQAVDWSAANRPAPSEDSASSDTAPGSDAPDLASTLDGWLSQIKNGDSSFLSDAIYTDVSSINSLVGAAGDLIVKGQRLDAICTEKFGQSLTEFSAAQAQGAPGLPDLSSFSVADLDIITNGDTAEVDAGDGTTIRFRLIDGAWKLDLSQDALPPEFAVVLPMLDQLGPVIPRMASAMDELIAETESGAYVSTQAVYIAQQQKLMPIMMEIMGSMQPPGGG